MNEESQRRRGLATSAKRMPVSPAEDSDTNAPTRIDANTSIPKIPATAPSPRLYIKVDNTADGARQQKAGYKPARQLPLFETTEKGYWDWNLRTGKMQYGPGWTSWLGYCEADISRDTSFWESMVHPDDFPAFDSCLKAHVAGKSSEFNLECRLRAKSGQYRWFQNCGRIIERDHRGRAIRMAGTILDVHDRKSAQDQLSKSEAQLMALFESTDDFVFSVDSRSFGLMTYNSALRDYAAKYLGIELHVGLAADEVLPADRAQQWVEFFGKAVREGNFSTDYDNLCGRKSVHLSFHRLLRNGEIFGVSVFARDITERKRMEEALRKSEEKFATAFRQSPMALTLTSLQDHRYLEVNETFEQWSGYSREEVLGRTCFDLGLVVHPPDVLEVARKVQAEGHLRNIGIKFRAKSGDIRDGLVAAERIEIDGEPCILSVIADVSDRKRADQALLVSEERLRLAVETGRMYAFEWDRKADTVQRSSESYEILGFSKSNLPRTKQEHISRIHPDEQARYISLIDSLNPKSPNYRISYRLLRPDGSTVWLEESGRAFFDDVGAPARVVGMIADVTESKIAEFALRELSGRLIDSQEEERRRVARELHDNIGQELALLTMRAQRIDTGVSDAEGTTHSEVHDLYKRIKEIAYKVSNLSHRLHSSELEFLGLAIASERCCREFEKQYHIDVDSVMSNVPQKLESNVALCFYRIIQESLQNVAQHGKAKNVRLELRGGADELILEIVDDGVGFDAQQARFGSGLGLISMRERMYLIGGTISIFSTPGKGTRVEARCKLPASKQGALVE